MIGLKIVIALSLSLSLSLSLRQGYDLEPQTFFRRGDPSELKTDNMFNLPWATSKGVVHVARDNCSSFVGQGFSCHIESPEHAMLKKWIPDTATVIEFGARFGSTTCEIAKKLQNSGKLLSVEPDKDVWDSLKSNVESHNCHARVLRGAISSSPLSLDSSGYGGRTSKTTSAKDRVPVFTFDEVEKASGLIFDTLLIDCEACGQDLLDAIDHKLHQIKLVLIEADQPGKMDYKVFFDRLIKSGMEQVDKFNDCDKTRIDNPDRGFCIGEINHYAFRRT